MSEDAVAVVHRYQRAMNEHDLERLLDCFDLTIEASSR
jgi:hypothetical protein